MEEIERAKKADAQEKEEWMKWVASPQAPWTPPTFPNIGGALAVRRCQLTDESASLEEWRSAADAEAKARALHLREVANAAEDEAIWAQREVEYWANWVPTSEDVRDWDQAWTDAWK